MPIKTVITKGKVPVKIYTDDIEHQAYQQLLNISQLPLSIVMWQQCQMYILVKGQQ